MRRLAMILSRMHLKNFKKYTSYDIEFGEGLIGIIGKNGSGKSTIFEAILFGLYGEFKKQGTKELAKNANASETDALVVELEFEFEEAQYRVQREFRGKTLTAKAMFYKNGELTTTGVKEVTSTIIKLTGLSKEAFMHTLFASQKELTSLSTLKNEERKKMIRRLLGLEKIDFIEKELIEKGRELKREINAFDQVLLGDDEVKVKKEQIKNALREKMQLTKEEQEKAKELISTKTQEQSIKKELDIFTKTKEQKQKLFSALELLKNTKTLELLNQTKLITQNDELQQKQKELTTLMPLKKEYLSLQEDLKNQEKLKEYHLKKEGLNKEQVNLREQYTKSKADIETLKRECEPFESYSLDAKNKELQLKQCLDALELKQTKEQELNLEIKTQQRAIDEASAKIAKIKELGKGSACPTCTRPLLEEYDNVINSLNEIVQGSHQKMIKEYSQELKNLQEQKIKLLKEKKIKELELLELTKKLSIITSKLSDLSRAKEHLKLIEQKGTKNKEELKLLEHYSYDEILHTKMHKDYDELTLKYKDILGLETELKRLDAVKIDLMSVSKNIEDLNKKEQEKEQEYSRVIYNEEAHKQKLLAHDEALKIVDAQTTTLNEKKVAIASIVAEINGMQNSLNSNEMQLKKVQTKKDDLVDYEKIKISLGEFKTKLNAKIAPRISALASEMYAQITKGKYQHIEVSNDFDFFIYDEGKKYPIERFSGGEIDLANLVLRIAISKTLTELSGASSMGFLAFDEVFGSQDESRRMEILEAFHTIKEQYRQIFLISHEMEIKEMFERVIEL